MEDLPTPMLSIGQGKDVKKMTANLLPCRIHHDGSIDPVGAYWKPSDTTTSTDNSNFMRELQYKPGSNVFLPSLYRIDDSKQAYFRGRKLQGTTVTLPDGYRGLIVERAADQLETEGKTSADGTNNAEDDEVVALETVGMMQATGEFDEMVVWSHESMATAATDPYVRSIEEWLQTCEKIHSFETEITE